MGKDGSERKQLMRNGGTVMSEEASVNTGAVWLDARRRRSQAGCRSTPRSCCELAPTTATARPSARSASCELVKEDTPPIDGGGHHQVGPGDGTDPAAA